MKVNKWQFIIGAILSLVGSWLVVVPQSDIGMPLLGISNILLIWYAITSIMEIYRNIGLSTDVD